MFTTWRVMVRRIKLKTMTNAAGFMALVDPQHVSAGRIIPKSSPRSVPNRNEKQT